MKLLYDLYSTQYGSFHGGKEYAYAVFIKLCQKLNKLNTIDNLSALSVDIIYNPNTHIDNFIINMCNQNNINIQYCKNHSDISNLLCNNKYNVFYSPLPYSFRDLIIPPETKFVYTIHGLRSYELPIDKDWIKYSKGNIIKKIIMFLMSNSLLIKNTIMNLKIKKFKELFNITNNQTIITISQHSKHSIEYFFPDVNTSNIKFLYSPLKKYDEITINETEYLSSLPASSGKYILLICGDISAKGPYRACNVLYKLIKNHPKFPQDIKVILLGVKRIKTYKKIVKNNSRFIFKGYVSSEELEVLYKNAYLFLYPTFNEGFGIPPLEAMKYGTICSISSNSSLTEIYKDSCLYFNPYDETEMSIRILQCFDENIRKDLSEKINIRFKQIREKQEKDLDTLINIISEGN